MTNPNASYAPEDCGWCGATGEDRADRAEFRCPVCRGQGSVLVAQPVRKCVNCDGNGTRPDDAQYRCQACSGSGWAHHFKPV